MLTLYHYWSSVCSQKVRLCLAEKKLPFQSRHIDLFTFEHWEPFYRKINQKGVVPALDHDGKIIIESNVLLEYLEDVFPATRLRPSSGMAYRVILDRYCSKRPAQIAPGPASDRCARQKAREPAGRWSRTAPDQSCRWSGGAVR